MAQPGARVTVRIVSNPDKAAQARRLLARLWEEAAIRKAGQATADQPKDGKAGVHKEWRGSA